MDRRLMLMENFSHWGVVCHCPGAIYMYMTIMGKIGKCHVMAENLLGMSKWTDVCL